MKQSLLSLLSVLLLSTCGQSTSESNQAGFSFNTTPSSTDLNRELGDVPVQDSKGMRFVVPYDRYHIDYYVKLLKFDGSSPETDSYTTVECRDLVGQVFTLKDLAARTIDGRACTLAVLNNDGALYASVINDSLTRVDSPEFKGRIPGLANLSLIEKARELLVGKTMYTLGHEPHDTDTTNSAFVDNDDYTYLPKYVPVIIRTVEPGQLSAPFKVTVEYTVDKLIHSSQYEFGSAPTNSELPDWRFTKRYSFSNPRDLHKGVDDVNWKAIQAGTPIKGMTMTECELAMGKPDSRAEHMAEEAVTEWFYENHIGKSWAVEFINGKVDRYASYDR